MKKLIIHHMTFKFDKQSPAFFENINISFDSGRIYFVRGKNGVGKSTLFSILQGTTPHNALLQGKISFNNQIFEIKNNNIDAKLSSQVKTVVQDSSKMIVTALTVKENLQLAQLPRYPFLAPLSSQVNLPPIMHDFGINLNMDVYKLSGGQKQMLAIIMALQKPTQLLLLDEPTAALDEKNTHAVIQFLTLLAQQLDLIVIIITHDKELVSNYAHHDNIIIKREEKNETRTIEQV